MIFVIVGTHEQQFNRLIKCIDKWALNHNEEVVIQIGYSTYIPKKAKWEKMYPYNMMVELVDKARIVITHGGPSSIIMPLQVGKIPIVVPRDHNFGEHVNNHQIDFCRKMEKRQKNIILVEDIDELWGKMDKYDEITRSMKTDLSSNNETFCNNFRRIVKDLVK